MATRALIQGRIVWAEVPDPQGRNAKERPLVILTENPSSDEDQLLTVAVTTQAAQADAKYCVPLPWSPMRGCHTELTAKSFAVCSWTCIIKKGDIQKFGGIVRPKTIQEILAKVKELESEGSSS